MAKLNFRYGAMNSGKTTILIQTAYNYEERDQKVLVIKPAIDKKGNDEIVSRIGATRKVDYLIGQNESIIQTIDPELSSINCLLVDEVQFLNPNQIFELFVIAKVYDVPVITFGLRTDFQTKGFDGSSRLMELADEVTELPTICRCGSKARFNARKINGEFVSEGESVAIDGFDGIEYESLCGKCYCEKVLNIIPKKRVLKKDE